MSISKFASIAGKYIADNSTTVLTVLAATGTIATAFFSGKASFKAARTIDEENRKREEESLPPLEFKEEVKLVWKFYIPAGLATAGAIGSVIGVNRIGTRRAAALATAYTLSEQAYGRYKDKVVEIVGKKKNQTIHDSAAQAQVEATPVTTREIIFTAPGRDMKCFDTFTGRYFYSDVEALRKAENELNKILIHEGSASLTEFYDLVGLDKTGFSDEVGWNSDQLLELVFSSVLDLDKVPCLAITFRCEPLRRYDRHS